jgi:hypothetical protein
MPKKAKEFNKALKNKYGTYRVYKKGIVNLKTGKVVIKPQDIINRTGKYNKRFVKIIREKLSVRDLNKAIKYYGKSDVLNNLRNNLETSRDLTNVSRDNRNRPLPFDDKGNTRVLFDQQTNRLYSPEWILTRGNRARNRVITHTGAILNREESKRRISASDNLLDNQFDDLINGTETTITIDLTKTNLLHFLNKIKDDIDKLIDVQPLLQFDGIIYALNEKTLKSLLKVVKSGGLITITEGQGSDVEIYKRMLASRYVRLTTRERERQEEAKQAFFQYANGAFFRYYNETNLNLDRYGVFVKDRTNYNDNCLYLALKNGGLDEVKLNVLRNLFITRDIPTNRLKLICEKLEICIVLKKMKNTKDDKYNNIRTTTYGDNTKPIYNIGLIDSHYFILEDTPFTKCYLENYEKLQDKIEGHRIYKFRERGVFSKYEYLQPYESGIDSFALLTTLIENKDKLLSPIEYGNEILKSHFYDKAFQTESLEYCHSLNTNLIVDVDEEDFIDEEDLDEDAKNKIKDMKKPVIKVFFDFETWTDETGKQNEYVVCFKYQGEDEKVIHFIGNNCGRQMLECLEGENIMMIAHNCMFDFTFLLKYLSCVRSVIFKGNSLISCDASYYKNNGECIKIRFKDSYRLITMPLRDFGGAFGIDTEKEVMPYDAYNVVNPLKNRYMKVKKFLSFFDNKKDRKLCLNNLKKWGCINNNDNKVNIIKYSALYCRLDVIVLEKGYNKFRGWMLELTDNRIDIDKKLTISSLAYEYAKLEGCFDECYEISGIPQQFISRAIVGGRTMLCDNKKRKITNGRIADMDVNSLYPFSLATMGGFLKGTPKIIKDEQKNYDNFLKHKDGFFVEIKINQVGIRRRFSLLSYVNDEGVRCFVNDEMVGKTIVVDKYMLEGMIKYQKVDFDIVRGYYYDEGRNNTIKKVIDYLYTERCKHKDNGNKIEMCYKLILNSIFGRCLLKPIEEDVDIVNEDKLDKYLRKNYNSVKTCQLIGKKYYVKKWKPILNHFNACHIGAEVLSHSKMVMNNIMCLIEDNGMGDEMYYSDTDSILMNEEILPKLDELFKKQNNGKTLFGKALGQMSGDFKIKDKNGNKIKMSEIYATDAVFLGKKMYMTKIKGIDLDGNEHIDYHCRMKGITPKSIDYENEYRNNKFKVIQEIKNKQNKNMTKLELYDLIYNNLPVDFDLLCGGKSAMFKYKKDNEGLNIYRHLKGTFTRRVQIHH